ncbi:MAG: 3-deoxy-8-phosphooctulonate synthase [Bacteroidia bacterium]|nr:3-deoxy-8-phosphooctulonate synthase [Bacteroidia bacterium]
MYPIQKYLDLLPSHSEPADFFLIAGPCAIEDETTPIEIARQLHQWCYSFQIPFIFKGSYRKANRSRGDSFTGIGDLKALQVLAAIREELKVPVLTDIHESAEAEMAAEYVDVLQIPAFLCRQTDLLVAAAKTGLPVNIKKGQFLSPEAMKFAVEKIISSGNNKVLVTERGTTFGYQDLIVDFRGIPIMQQFGVPVVLDLTHSLQQPNQASGVTGGRPQLIETLARAGAAVGVDGFFIETHPEPSQAKSDAENMLRLELLPSILEKILAIRNALKPFKDKHPTVVS